MNTILTAIRERRSCKNYKPDAVPAELIDQVIEAGLFAASAQGKQCPMILAVTNKETRDKLSRANAAIMGVETDPFYGAPCVIVVLADPAFPTWIDDGSLVMGNLLNAAHALGLGSCWINRAREYYDTAEGKELLKKWGVPESYRGIGNVILGYPDEEPAPKDRVEGRIIKV